jgi:hypothetical protein
LSGTFEAAIEFFAGKYQGGRPAVGAMMGILDEMPTSDQR